MIGPYKSPPKRRKVALVQPDGRVTFEDGRTYQISGVPESTSIYADRDDVRRFTHGGRGEQLRWAGVVVKWRVDGRQVTALGGGHGSGPDVLAGLVALRDFLEAEGATLRGSFASASKSLWRATTDRQLWLGVGDLPPVHEVIGGRQTTFVQAGYVGEFRKIDLPAAYASALGGLGYGGKWHRRAGLPAPDAELPCFVRASVSIPAGIVGPLPVRARNRPKPRPRWWEYEPFRPYPHGRRLQGIWTAQEIHAAIAAGCDVRVLDVWDHFTAGRPFARWWDAIAEARKLPGKAGTFGKVMGNALWGSFALNGERRVVAFDAEGRKVKDVRRSAVMFSPWDDRALAETISGRIRARLYAEVIAPNPTGLIAVHTDGALIGPDATRPKGWRVQESGDQLVVWDQQTYAWRDRAGGQRYVMAGTPARLQPERWRAHLDLLERGARPPTPAGIWEGEDVVA